MDVLLRTKYEQMLIGNSPSNPYDYFPYTAEVNMKMALDVFRYAFEQFLRWTPLEVRDYINMDILDKLKLTFFLRYIQFPVELDPGRDLFYLAWLMYPQTIHMSETDLILNVYKGVLDRSLKKYPKEFFTGNSGYVRAMVCLKYALENGRQFENLEELYAYYASPDVWKFLKEAKLDAVCKDLFRTPVEYLHECLSDAQRDEFLYHYYTFLYDKWAYEKQEKLKKRAQVSASKKKKTEACGDG